MWYREYENKKNDESLIQVKVETGKGIVGCEMHDLAGWGQTHHVYKRKKRGIFAGLKAFLFGSKIEEETQGDV